MPRYEITSPDGQRYEVNAPDGATEEEVMSYAQQQFGQTKPAEQPPAGPAPSMMESFGKGMEDGTTFGFSDEMRSFGRGLGAMMVGRDYNDAYNRRYNQLKQERDAAKQNGWTYFGGELTGGIGTAVATAPISGVPSVAKFAQAHPYLTAGGLGGMSGYLYGAGTGEGTTQQRLEGAVPQAAFGMVAGPAATLLARSAVGPLSKRVLEYLEKRKAQPPRIPPTVSGNLSQDQVVNQMVQASDNALTPAPAGRSDMVATNKMVEAIKRDYPDNYEQILSAWKESNQPLAEISGPSMTRIATGAAQYESGLPKAVKYFSEQTGESADKLLKSVYQNIGDSRSYFATVDDVLAKGRAKAAPLYNKAYEQTTKSGKNATIDFEKQKYVKMPSVDPAKSRELEFLEKNIENIRKQGREPVSMIDSANKLRSQINKAQKQKIATFPKKFALKNGNYEYSARELADGIENIKQDYDVHVDTSKMSESTYLTISKKDGSEGIKIRISDHEDKYGGNNFTYSPKNEPVAELYKKINAFFSQEQGVDLMPEVMSAIKEARKKYPSELQGFPDNSIKVLDYAKRVLDDQIGQAKRSGENNFARSRTEIKDSLLAMMDDASPEYKQARAIAGDYLSATDAMETGQNFMKVDPELIKKTLASKSPQDIEAFKLGMSKRIADLINDANEGKNPYQRVFGSETKKERLRVSLAPDKYKKLEIDMKARNRLYEMGNKVLGGSPTTGKAMAAADLAPDEELITALTSGTKQNILGYLKKTFTGMGDDVANSVSDILYETDPTKKLQLLYNVNKSTLTSTEKQLVKEAYFQTADKLSFGSGVAGGIAVGRKPPEEK